jgi:hypothetical protein
MKVFNNIFVLVLLLASATLVAAQAKDEKKPDAQQPAAQQPAENPYNGGTVTSPMPKSKEEAAAYNALIQLQDPVALDLSAADFVAKFPDSNLKGVAYQRVMVFFENAGPDKADKAIEAGKKALNFDANDPLTNAELASLIASHTKASDLDKDEKLADVHKYADAAIKNVDSPRVDSKSAAAAVDTLKADIKAEAYNALGLAAFVNKDYANAEVNFQKTVEANPAQPDPVALLRLGVAQRNLGKLEAALASFNKSIDAANAAQLQQVVTIATGQRDDVQKLIDRKKAAAPATAPAPKP